jgi:uncharacterized membrane protein
MANTIAALFDTRDQAQRAVQDLIDNGIASSNISIVSQDARGDVRREVGGESKAAEGAGTGAVSGGLLGGALGLLVGIGALAIPGIGPVIAAGPLAAALGSAGAGTVVGAAAGAATGGIIGALVGAGIPENEAHVYAEGVRRGGTLVLVDNSSASASMVTQILRNDGSVDVNQRGAEWRQSGWDRFDTAGGPYTRR